VSLCRNHSCGIDIPYGNGEEMHFKEVLKCRFVRKISIPKADVIREEPIGKWFPRLSLAVVSAVH
jgi:hypothetical protein